MKIQLFIEFIRAGNLLEATNMARTVLSKLEGASQHHDAFLMDALSLLAYEQPEKSEVSYLMSTEQREAVADIVNSAMHVASLPSGEADGLSAFSLISKLEYALLQLCRVHQGLFDENQRQGKAFQLKEHLL